MNELEERRLYNEAEALLDRAIALLEDIYIKCKARIKSKAA